MKEEIKALDRNKTQDLVDEDTGLTSRKRIISCKWAYKLKRNSNGSKRFRARLVITGFEQEYGTDYNETFAPVAKFVIVCILFALAAKNDQEMGAPQEVLNCHRGQFTAVEFSHDGRQLAPVHLTKQFDAKRLRWELSRDNSNSRFHYRAVVKWGVSHALLAQAAPIQASAFKFFLNRRLVFRIRYRLTLDNMEAVVVFSDLHWNIGLSARHSKIMFLQ